jgi:hypothetical protein
MMRAMQMRGWMVAGGVALALAVAGAWLSKRGSAEGDAAQAGANGGASGWGMISASNDAPGAGAPQAAGPALTPEQVRNRLFKEGSFAGTEPAGDWCVQAGQLKACPELRKRFEYYILGLGEVTMRTYTWRNKFDQSDRSSWMPVFEEQKLVRRQILGADWAKAFFDEDEQNFKQYYAQLESGLPPPPDPGEPVPQMAPGKDPAAVTAERVARYGQAAADRLAKVDEEWADWERRLGAARVEWDRMKADPSLSDAQRKEGMQAYVVANFKKDEYLRVQALLHL